MFADILKETPWPVAFKASEKLNAVSMREEFESRYIGVRRKGNRIVPAQGSLDGRIDQPSSRIRPERTSS
jgi:hypothetical protein